MNIGTSRVEKDYIILDNPTKLYDRMSLEAELRKRARRQHPWRPPYPPKRWSY